MSRQINTEEKKLPEFIEMLVEEKYLIPSFQRDFVWEPDGIVRLWDSLYRYYPIGSILCWESDILLNIYRKLGGYIFQNSMEKIIKLGKWIYILDGQQRATSLLISIFGGEGKIRNKIELFNYRMYFDATDGSFFFENELGRRGRNNNPHFLIPL